MSELFAKCFMLFHGNSNRLCTIGHGLASPKALLIQHIMCLRGADDDLLCNWTSVKLSHDAGTPFKLIVSANFAPSPSLLSQAASHSTSHRKRLRQRTSVSSVTVSDSRCLTNAQSGGGVATSIQTATRHSASQRDRKCRTNSCRIV